MVDRGRGIPPCCCVVRSSFLNYVKRRRRKLPFVTQQSLSRPARPARGRQDSERPVPGSGRGRRLRFGSFHDQKSLAPHSACGGSGRQGSGDETWQETMAASRSAVPSGPTPAVSPGHERLALQILEEYSMGRKRRSGRALPSVSSAASAGPTGAFREKFPATATSEHGSTRPRPKQRSFSA